MTYQIQNADEDYFLDATKIIAAAIQQTKERLSRVNAVSVDIFQTLLQHSIQFTDGRKS